MQRVVTIDGHQYAVSSGTYIERWVRQFTATLVANLVELNYVDNGPGIKTYSMTLLLSSWDPQSQPYKDGVIESWDTQKANLEASYLKKATALQYIDPFGQSPTLGGVYFTMLNQIIPNYSTAQKPYVLCEIEIRESLTAIS